MSTTEALDAAAIMSPRWHAYGCAGTWQRGTINIRQRIGELTVGQMSFAGAILANDFLTAPLLGPEIDDLPVNEFPRGCDAIKIASAPVEAAPAPLRLGRKAIRYVPFVYERHFIALRRFKTYDEYLQRFSGKRRHELRRMCRAFSGNASEPEFTVFRAAEEMETFHRLASAVSAKTYQANLVGAGLDASAATRDALCAAAAAGLVRGYLLSQDGIPAAFGLCELEGSRLLYDKTGYDPQFAARSPGTVLMCKIIESLFQEPQIATFDFAEGTSVYKEKFATDSRLCADVLFFRPTLRATFGVLSNRALAVSSWCAVQALDALQLKSRIKKLIRRAGS